MRAVTFAVDFTVTLLFWLLIAFMSPVRADPDSISALTARLRELPASFGENRTIAMRRGERWTTVGIREHAGYEQMHRANPRGVKPGPLLISGRHIAPAEMDTGIVVNVPELTLFFFEDGRVTHWYPVSTGMIQQRWHTTPYNYTVYNKVKNPTWYRPPFAGGGSMPPGPRNPLGDRAIYLNPISRMVAIHSTNDITTIGKYVSHSCIRMFPPHIHQLFEFVKIGMPVRTEYETIKVGQENGIVYLAIFPDVYRRGANSPTTARGLLERYQVSGAVSDTEMKSRLVRPDGVARSILGSSMPVIVNGNVLAPPIGPTLRDGSYYLPLATLAEAIGGQMTVDAESHSPAVIYQGKKLVFPADGRTAFRALATVFVSMRAFTEGFAGRITADDGKLTITFPQ